MRRRKPNAAVGDDAIVVVSGLPRSGTSLVMQMLAAGGIEPMTDSVRGPDRDNPNGYFEWEDIKRIARDHRILEPPEVRGRAIKVISTLLPDLPKAHHYKVLFMQRDMDEIVRSQTRMLTAQNRAEASQDPRDIARRLSTHNAKIVAWAIEARHIDILTLDHRTMIQRPAAQIADIASFLGPSKLPHPEAMASQIDQSLYRNRTTGVLEKLKRMGRSHDGD